VTVHAPQGQQHPIEKSRELQRRLYLAAKRSRNRRFHALYDRMFRPDVLWRAWVEVRANGGSPGVDGARIEDVDRQGAETFLRELVAAFLERLKLTLRPRKTRVVDMGAGGFDFLGFHFHKLPSRQTGRLVAYAWPSQKAMKAVRGKIREQTERTRLRVELGELVGALNRLIVGWRAYFSIGNSTKRLADLDRYVRFRLWRFLRKRQGPRGRLLPAALGLWSGNGGVGWRTSTHECGEHCRLAGRKVKAFGKPYEGKPHVRFDVAESGDQTHSPRRHPSTLPADGRLWRLQLIGKALARDGGRASGLS